MIIINDLFSGERRFSKPQAPSKWNGMRDASHFGNECHQQSISEYTFQVGEKPVARDEDCLYLNVYVPHDDKTDHSLAVMVWIHGGGYVFGAGSQYDGTELAATGVIVVTINYRLDIFGFLSNENTAIPGNFGMLDQIMALKWVKENIWAFGGDANKITIFGESAGSASVSLLVLSPLASGLFNRAIMQSGVSLSPWAVTTQAARITPRTLLSLVGNAVGCTDYDADKKLQCFRRVDAALLLNASRNVENIFPSASLFAPRVENIFSFLPDLPISLLAQNRFNHVDMIHGYTTDESAVLVLNEERLGAGLSKDDFTKFLASTFDPYVFTDKDVSISETVASYVGNETDRGVIRYAAVRAVSDFEFIGPTVTEARIQSALAKENKHYLYEFNYKPSYSKLPRWLNAIHGEDIPFVFGVNLPEFELFRQDKSPNGQDNLVWSQMKTLWSNFAKYGNPTHTLPVGAVAWTQYDAKTEKYLQIGESSQMSLFSNTKATAISKEMLPKLQTTFRPVSIVG